ncbi:hypothetical protein [Pseudoalteromonas luteoviolacea]|nr:hypothetical protein [Pseudoalteromonas luteoviolacea]
MNAVSTLFLRKVNIVRKVRDNEHGEYALFTQGEVRRFNQR